MLQRLDCVKQKGLCWFNWSLLSTWDSTAALGTTAGKWSRWSREFSACILDMYAFVSSPDRMIDLCIKGNIIILLKATLDTRVLNILKPVVLCPLFRWPCSVIFLWWQQWECVTYMVVHHCSEHSYFILVFGIWLFWYYSYYIWYFFWASYNCFGTLSTLLKMLFDKTPLSLYMNGIGKNVASVVA